MPTENRSSNTEMVSDILPCPFCKAAMRIESNRDWHRLMGDHDDECVFIDPETMTVPATDEQRAIMVNDWNRRAQPAEQHQAEPVASYSMDPTGCEEPNPDGPWVRYEDLRLADPGEVERLREEVGGLEQVVKLQVEALKGLTFAARTTGGTAGPDHGLIQACEKAEHAISLGGIGKAYMSGADAALSASAEPSAPVEVDHDALVAAVCVLRSQGLGNLSAAVEEARAALERQPS